MKRSAADAPVMSRRQFGALAGGAAAASLLLSPARSFALRAGSATWLGGGVAANLQDRQVFAWSLGTNELLLVVLTESGELFGHRVTRGPRGGISAPWRAGKIQPPDSGVRWVLPTAGIDGLYVVRSNGEVVFHQTQLGSSRITFRSGGPVEVPTPVGVNPEDRRALITLNGVVVLRNDGAAGFHRIRSSYEWTAGAATSPDSYRPVAANAADKWILPVCVPLIGVITTSGELFTHHFGGSTIGPPHRANLEQPIAANPQDRFVVSTADAILVITNTGDVFEHKITECGV